MAWLQKLKAEGHDIRILDDEPLLNPYEMAILRGAQTCEHVADIIAYGQINGVPDLVEYVDLVAYCKNRMGENARN